MTSRKERRKARHRAEKTMDEAFEALLAGRDAFAEKLARRSVAAGEMNARLWLDLGRILARTGHHEDAEEAMRRAIALAPNYGEAFAELAAFQAAAAKWPQAERLQRRAVELRPGDAEAVAKLQGYAAMVSREDADAQEVEPETVPTALTERFDWADVAAGLRAHGVARLDGLVSSEQCAALRGLWAQDCFEHDASVERGSAGWFESRSFAAPLPPFVQLLREELYARLAPIANTWQEWLGRRLRFPPSLGAFLRHGIEVGQHRPGPCLLRFPVGGHRAPVRDAGQRLTFPFRLEVPLGPEAEGTTLCLLDVRSSRKRRQHAFAAKPGCGFVFATAERLVEIAGIVAAQPVEYGTPECAAEQIVLGVPFHDVG